MYIANATRYQDMPYRRCGSSGLLLPAVSIGLWHNFGGVDTLENGRAMLRRAFDLGITHFDLANNYGPPYGSAETNFGVLFRQDWAPPNSLLYSWKPPTCTLWTGACCPASPSWKLLAARQPETTIFSGGILAARRFHPRPPASARWRPPWRTPRYTETRMSTGF